MGSSVTGGAILIKRASAAKADSPFFMLIYEK